MAFLRLCILSLALCAAAAGQAWAASAETRAFEAAWQSFEGAFYERAEAEFADFAAKYSASPRVPEAILHQAEARMKLGNLAGAIELLSERQASAGGLADRYLFTLAQAQSRQSNYVAAADALAELSRDYPQSLLRLEAVVGEAVARARVEDWARVSELLRQTNGVFQNLARANPTNDLVLRGQLLLSEAQLARQDTAGAEAALEPLGQAALRPEFEWQKEQLRCRIRLAESRWQDALNETTNLLAAAQRTGQSSLKAEATEMRATLLERLGSIDEAIATSRSNLVAGVPAERQRRALLKITELLLGRGRLTQAADTLQQFLTQFPKAEAADVALLTMGEMWLKEQLPGTGTNILNATTNQPAGTNGLERAITFLSRLTTNYPNSDYAGRAYLDLGWCFWASTNLPASRRAFQAALPRLTEPLDLATACFKLGDAEYEQHEFTNAVRDYRLVVDRYGENPAVRSNLLEQALYQVVRAGMQAGELGAATNALERLLQEFPTGFHTDRALLLAGPQITRAGNPEGVRELFEAFLSKAPGSELSARVRLAIARTYEQQEQWTNAIEVYDQWLESHTNHPEQARAEFCRAMAFFHAGQETNALSGFTNFIAHFPTNEFTPRAQFWLGDYQFRNGNFPEAEMYYRSLFKTWPGSELAYPAQMMAGRAAMARQGWNAAAECFTTLYKDTNCPTDLRLQALFAYGDYCLSRDSTNKLSDCREALSAYEGIWRWYPTNRLAPLALGQTAICYWQWALLSKDYDSATNALNGFEQVLTNSTLADAKARSIAKVGQGVVLEQMAQQKPGDDKEELLNRALNAYLDVFYDKVLRDGETPDLFWKKEAGLKAARLAEELQRWDSAIRVYAQLQEMIPVLRDRFGNKIAALRAHQTASDRP